GGKIKAEQCLRCHEHGLNSCSFKRGAPFTPERDVHAAAGMDCIDCHTVQDHKFARGSRVTDMHGWELPEVEVACANCHGATPHAISVLNDHFEIMMCETCHIPHAAGVERQVWAPTFGITEGPEANVPIYNEETGRYEPYINIQEDEFTPPSYKWFNGQVSFLAEPLADAFAFTNEPPTRDTPGAKIQPFRNLVNGMIMDKNGIAMFGPEMPNPNYDPKWTYLAFVQSASAFMIQAGFMRPEGLRPEEEAFLGAFPNLLTFDQEKYFATGDIEAAINLGLGRFGAYGQGMNPFTMTEAQLVVIGSQMWSGEYVGLDLPDNPLDPAYIPDVDPRTNVGSFITISHAVTKDGALKCADCHRSGGRLNFAQLGYDQEKSEELTTLLGDLSAFEGDLDGSGDVGPEDLLILQKYWMQSQKKMMEELQRQ
ncbi:MAG: hypothetical protein KC964_24290, partial [Candidatus Omnitrophica bacterium]|nr:hypothetical protein [Candidatus Omnitrophota bacterium]